MKMDLEGKVAFVTGGASGIGESITRSLLENGVSVLFLDSNKAKGEELVRSLGSGKAHFVCGDVSKRDQLEGAMKTTVDMFSRLDIVVNNAGLGYEGKWEDMIDVNLKAVVRGTKEGTKRMSKENGGSGGVVVNISSVVGMSPFQIGPVYSATKHAVIGFTRSHDDPDEHERTGVRTVAVCPGVTRTGLLEGEAGSKVRKFLAKYKMPYLPQGPEVVAASTIETIRSAPNASIWVVEYGGPAYQVQIPDYATFKVGGD